jgi:hypothetical protein
MVLHETKTLHSKENGHQTEEMAYRMRKLLKSSTEAPQKTKKRSTK